MAASPSCGGNPQAALEVGPACTRICWWFLVGWAGGDHGGTHVGSLDPFILPGVTSQCPRPGPTLRLLPLSRPCDCHISAASLLSGQERSFYLFLASCLRRPLKSESLQEVPLGV